MEEMRLRRMEEEEVLLQEGGGDDGDDDDEFKGLGQIMETAMSMQERREEREELLRRVAGDITGLREASRARIRSTEKSLRNRLRFRLFNSSLWRIESYYGAVVVSFFKFLKWTMALNIVSLIFIMGLVLTPQLIENTVDDDENVEQYKWKAEDNCNSTFSLFNETGIPWAPVDEAHVCCSFLYEAAVPSNVEFNADTAGDFFKSLWTFMQVRIMKL